MKPTYLKYYLPVSMILFQLLAACGYTIGNHDRCDWRAVGVVWWDKNSDGIWGADEEPLSNIRVFVGYEDDDRFGPESINVTNSEGKATLDKLRVRCEKSQLSVHVDPISPFVLTTSRYLPIHHETREFHFGLTLADGEELPQASKERSLVCEAQSDRTDFNDMLLDNDDNAWVLSKGLLVRYGPDGTTERFTTSDGVANDYSRGFTVDDDGTVWIATIDGVLSYKNGELRHLISGARFRSVAIDQNGLVWLGSFRKGLAAYDPKANTWRQFGKSDGLPSDNEPVVHQTIDSSVWVASVGRLYEIVEDEESQYSWVLIEGGLNETPLNSWGSSGYGIYFSTDNKIWSHGTIGETWRNDNRIRGHPATTNSIASYDLLTETWHVYNHKTTNGIMFADALWDMDVAPDNSIWLASRINGVLHLIPGTNGSEDKWEVFDEKNGLPNNRAEDLLVTRDNVLWVATADGLASCQIIKNESLETG